MFTRLQPGIRRTTHFCKIIFIQTRLYDRLVCTAAALLCSIKYVCTVEQIVNVLSNTRLPFIVDCYYVVGLCGAQSSLDTLFVESDCYCVVGLLSRGAQSSLDTLFVESDCYCVVGLLSRGAQSSLDTLFVESDCYCVVGLLSRGAQSSLDTLFVESDCYCVVGFLSRGAQSSSSSEVSCYYH